MDDAARPRGDCSRGGKLRSRADPPVRRDGRPVHRTDRSIGDALGPAGGQPAAGALPEGVTVLGTLDKPVHAGNLTDALAWVERNFRRPLVLAVDACLGRAESVGFLAVGTGSLRPGAGVSKSLPPAGDVYLTGVVNVGGFMEYFVLQNTRLSLVMRMAQVAAAGLEQGLRALLLQAGPGRRKVT